jgi:Concanavalin A-like lectin/glucanases superfamily
MPKEETKKPMSLLEALSELLEVLKVLWSIGSYWLRLALWFLILAPILFLLPALLGWQGFVGWLALLVLLAGALLLVRNPLIIPVGATIEFTSRILRFLVGFVIGDLLFALYFAIVPVINNRNLVPLVIICGVLLFLTVNFRVRGVGFLRFTLSIGIIVMTAYFFLGEQGSLVKWLEKVRVAADPQVQRDERLDFGEYDFVVSDLQWKKLVFTCRDQYWTNITPSNGTVRIKLLDGSEFKIKATLENFSRNGDSIWTNTLKVIGGKEYPIEDPGKWSSNTLVLKEETAPVDVHISVIRKGLKDKNRLENDQATVTTPNLLASYQFEDNSNDWSSNTHNGADINVSYSVGEFGKGANFDGRTSFISIADDSSFSPLTLSLTFWVKPNALPSSGDIAGIIDKRATSDPFNGWQFELFNNKNTQKICWQGPGNSTEASWTYTLPTNMWTHVAIVHSGKSATLYINGVSQGTSGNFSITDAAVPLLIGKRHDGFHYDGELDEINIFSKALTASEVRLLMHNSIQLGIVDSRTQTQ